MSLQKRFQKNGKVKVTFRLPAEYLDGAQAASLVGDFNDWDEEATPMTRLKSGDFKVTLDLEPGREYQFRYLIDGQRWQNDWDAELYTANPFSGDNSVVTTHPA